MRCRFLPEQTARHAPRGRPNPGYASRRGRCGTDWTESGARARGGSPAGADRRRSLSSRSPRVQRNPRVARPTPGQAARARADRPARVPRAPAWPVARPARAPWPAVSISPKYERRRGSASSLAGRLLPSVAKPMIDTSRLLNSWTTPADTAPIVKSRSRRCCRGAAAAPGCSSFSVPGSAALIKFLPRVIDHPSKGSWQRILPFLRRARIIESPRVRSCWNSVDRFAKVP